MIWYLLLAIGLTIFFWEEVKSPFVERYEKNAVNKRTIVAAERIARVKMLSDSAKDIEDFISKNVSVISDETMNALVARLENIKSDKIIEGDALKSKFDYLYDQAVEAVEPAPAQTKKRGIKASA